MSRVLFCIGNPQKGDDIVALKLGEKIEKTLPSWRVVYGYDLPENHLHEVRNLNPDIIVVADASVGMENRADFIELSEDTSYTFSTHNIPLPILIRYMGEFCKRVLFLGLKVKEKNLIFKENFLTKDGEKSKEAGIKKILELEKFLLSS